MFQIPHVCWSVLLVVSSGKPFHAHCLVVDQWLAYHDRRMDYFAERQFWCFAFSPLISVYLLRHQGTAQLIVAGAGIYHPDWIATAWQTCTPSSLCFSSPTEARFRLDFPRCYCRFEHLLHIFQ